ncbi:MAG: prepilin peptidase [Coriobacteriales bacterium]|jgi:leader peptidase (prepilin peptidase)/N-methyltransferase
MSLFASPALCAYVLFVTAVLGLVMGSFINCAAWRSVRGQSFLKGRSHCATCGHVLSARDLVPVFSWVFSKGRCRYCGQKISVRYPLTELCLALVYVSIVLRYDLTLESVEMLVFASLLFAVALIDLDSFTVPNGLLVAAVLDRLLYLLVVWLCDMSESGAVLDSLVLSLVSALVVGFVLLLFVLLMDRVLKRPSMGGGDVKLLALAAFFFGWQQSLYLIVIACVFGIVFGLIAGRHGNADSERGEDADVVPTRAFPWGPSIALACWVTMLSGAAFVGWYLGLFRL